MKILFLDFDGVLNSSTFRRDYRRGLADASLKAELSPVMVAHVNRICDATGALVVLSTAWRTYAHLRPRLIEFLESAGFTGTVIGMTPDFVTNHPRDPYTIGPHKRTTRGMEIRAWLDEHPEVDRYVVLEDSEDMTPLPMRRIVWTSDSRGLTKRQADRAIEILNG